MGGALGVHWGRVTVVAGLRRCTWGRGQEGAMALLAPFSAGLQSLPLLPTITLGPAGADSSVGGLVRALGPCGSLQGILLWGWEFLLLLPQPAQVFSIRGLRLYFPALEPWVAGSASCSLACPIPRSASSLGPPAVALLWVLSAPPTGLNECFFFISFVLGLPYSSIFCQFWLFFVCKLLLSSFWLCEEAQDVYLHLHLGRKPQPMYFKRLYVKFASEDAH